MKYHRIIAPFFLAAFLVVTLSATAQRITKPEHRFALRLNVLGILSLSERFELEYLISKRLGVFAGSGFGKEPITAPFGFYLYKARFYNPFCRTCGGSAYAGVRIGLPIWKFVGLSFKALIIGSHFKAVNTVPGSIGCNSGIDGPPVADPYYRNSLTLLACLAYAQTFGKHFFVEPVVGIGPVFTSLQGKAKPDYWTNTAGLQLNLGVRF